MNLLTLTSGPSCSKLTMSLVNESSKFTSSDMQICWNFLLKNVSSFCSAKATQLQKLLTFFQQKISEYCILNPLKQLTKWPLTSSLSELRFEQPGPGRSNTVAKYIYRIRPYYRTVLFFFFFFFFKITGKTCSKIYSKICINLPDIYFKNKINKWLV